MVVCISLGKAYAVGRLTTRDNNLFDAKLACYREMSVTKFQLVLL